jgi:hypothetical protein
MSNATGHNSFMSQYLLNIYILQILQIMYNKFVKKMLSNGVEIILSAELTSFLKDSILSNY